ncbi:hypothetical protein Clacol_008386 [Clathrus columnatus]|uniref:6-phosphogluconolactonase n=1 Tax=Clathrus columnatus TaxID=1419009 RepID=A0AAV5AHM5_9AGAM|nr:hypothetical protein Clacol_008386 [Clathrus columnatus]
MVTITGLSDIGFEQSATNELTDGLLLTFTVGSEGELDLIQEVTSGGRRPANLLALSRSDEYGSGNGLVYPLEPDLVHVVTNPPPPLITFNPAPNLISHPHEALEVGDQLFVADLGADKIWRLNKTLSQTWEISSFIQQVNGTGPRHMALKNDILFVVDETASLLTSQRIPPDGVTSPQFIEQLLTTPAGVNSTNYKAAEIQIPPPIDGSSQMFIFVSNRQIAGVEDVRGDPIAVFLAHDDGSFQLINEVFTGLNNLRGFIFDPSGRYLVAGGNIAGGIKIYERVGDGSKLVEVAATTQVPTASSFVWLPKQCD